MNKFLIINIEFKIYYLFNPNFLKQYKIIFGHYLHKRKIYYFLKIHKSSIIPIKLYL
jgi:hypothetical protein